jgi:hypothetical protein
VRMGLRDAMLGTKHLCDSEMTNEDKVKALVDYYGYTEEEARNMLVDMGEIEPGWCEG